VELEILFVGLATGFAAGVGLTTWWSMRAVRAERRAERVRPVVVVVRDELVAAPAWSGNTITARGTAREVEGVVTVETAAVTEREPDTWRSRR